MPRRISLTAAVLAVATFVGAAAASAGTIPIGEAGPSAGCLPNYTFWQLSGSASYTVPSGSWTLTSWSTDASSFGGQMAVVVLRPAGSSYTVVGVGPVETLTASSLNTFAVSIAVRGGDILGLWTSGGTCAQNTGSASDTYQAWFGATPTPGQTLNPGGAPLTGFLVDISATLAGAGAAFVRPPDHVFLCYSKFEQDGGAVFAVGQSAALLAAGYWYPSAVPGNIDGGDNIGDYHLECNLHAGLKRMGTYLDDGGDVLSDARFGPYAIVGWTGA